MLIKIQVRNTDSIKINIEGFNFRRCSVDKVIISESEENQWEISKDSNEIIYTIKVNFGKSETVEKNPNFLSRIGENIVEVCVTESDESAKYLVIVVNTARTLPSFPFKYKRRILLREQNKGKTTQRRR